MQKIRKKHIISKILTVILCFVILLQNILLTVRADETNEIILNLIKNGKVDIMLVSKNTTFTTEQMQQLEAKIKEQLAGYDINFVGLETKTTTQETIQGTFQAKISFPADDMDTHVYFYNDNTQLGHIWYQNKSWSGQSFDRDSTSGGAELLTLNYSALPDNCNKIEFQVYGYRGSQQTRFQLIKNNADGTSEIPVDVSQYVSEHTYVPFGTFTKNSNNGWDFTSFDGTFISGTKVILTITSKSMTDILRDATWRDEATHIIIDVDTELDPSLTESGELTSRLIADDVYIQFWGSDKNQSTFTQYGQGLGKDENGEDKYSFVNQNSGYDTCVSSTINGIEEIISAGSASGDSQYGIINEITDISVTPASAKTNTADSQYPNGKWKIVHDDTKIADDDLQNSLGVSNQSGMYMNNLTCSFDKPGNYAIYYKDKLVNTVYIHRRPVADFTIGWNPSTKAVTIGDTSYDLDTNKGTKGNGIQSVTWQYKKATASTWTNGYPTTWQASDGITIIQMTVTDYQGCSSSVAKYLGDTKPVASFSYNLNPVSLYEEISILNSSYDTSGYSITSSRWILRDASGNQIATNNTNNVGSSFVFGVPHNLNMQEGTYSISLTVTNSAGNNSETVSRTFRVVKVVSHALYEYNWNNAAHDIYPEYADVYYKAPYPELTQPSKKYSVEFNENSGNSISAESAEAVATFAGWYLDSALTQKITSGSTVVNSNGNHTIYAKWTNNNVTFPNAGKSYTVSFDAQNTATDIATGNTSPLTETWTFNGWYDNKSGGNLIGKAGTNYTLSENKTLYAQWTDVPVTLPNLSKKFTVQFDTNGGSACNPVTANVKFNGWYTAASGGDYVGTGGNKYTVNSNHTLYAHWSNADIMMPLSTKKGYTFTGWNTQADGKGTSYAADTTINTITADNGATITLYAQWKIKSSEIQVDINLPDRKIKDTNHPTVIIKLSGKDMDGNHVTKVLPYTFSSGGKQSKKVTLKAGNYTITEILPARYKVDSIKGSSTMKANGNSAAIDFTDAADSTICFEQKCITSAYISGSDQKINTI